MRKRITVECPDQLYLDFDFDINGTVMLVSVDYDEKSESVNDRRKKEVLNELQKKKDA